MAHEFGGPVERLQHISKFALLYFGMLVRPVCSEFRSDRVQ